jgi:hypothetical protein
MFLEAHIASIFRVKSKPSKKPTTETGSNLCSASCLLNGGFLLCLLFHLEDGGDVFLRKVG